MKNWPRSPKVKINLNLGLKAKFSAESAERQKTLTEEKKVLDAMFEEELIEEVPLRGVQKSQIMKVAQVNLEAINSVLKNVD